MQSRNLYSRVRYEAAGFAVHYTRYNEANVQEAEPVIVLTTAGEDAIPFKIDRRLFRQLCTQSHRLRPGNELIVGIRVDRGKGDVSQPVRIFPCRAGQREPFANFPAIDKVNAWLPATGAQRIRSRGCRKPQLNRRVGATIILLGKLNFGNVNPI